MNSIKVKVLSDIVCNNLFRNISLDDNRYVEFKFAPVDQFVTEIINHNDESFLLLHLTKYAFNSYEVNQEFVDNIEEILSQLENLIKKRDVKVILNNICFNTFSFSQDELIRKKNYEFKVNKLILDFCKEFENSCLLVDTNSLISSFGKSNHLNYRNYGIMRFPYSKDLSMAIKKQYESHFSSYFNTRKKVVFVDADNTLWGGILGEDGINGIKIDHEYPGSYFFLFQTMLKQLKNQGILLCLVTKNNYSDIEEVFKIKDMPLQLDDFIEVRANWDRKSKNIDDLLDTLNIGSSAALFIDDNPFEIEEVGMIYKEINCIQFKIEDFGDIQNKLLDLSDLYAHNLTNEDKLKAETYNQEKERKSFLEESNSIEEYLKGLSITITIHHNDVSLVPRIAQLTQKTNQFNLTTKRYSIPEIESLIANENIYAYSVDDKFGSMGVVGVVIIVDDKIDTFLLSCRAFGRQIEKTALISIINHLNKYPIYAKYIPSKKNIITKEFFSDNGFEIIDDSDSTIDFCLNGPLGSQDFIQEVIWK